MVNVTSELSQDRSVAKMPGHRYRDRVTEGMPERICPRGGARVKGLDPQVVAQRIERACRKRSSDVILPGYLRPIVAIGHLRFLRSVIGMLLWFTRQGKAVTGETDSATHPSSIRCIERRILFPHHAFHLIHIEPDRKR
ncbi:MAG: hypothetical protein R3C05_01000 [Pirellulaceae bacterium]